MRRVLVLVLVALAAASSAGCSGQDAQTAERILDQSTTATASVRSISFAMRMWTSGGPAGTDFTVLMRGGGYQKGKRSGEAYVTVSSSGVPGLGSMTIVTRETCSTSKRAAAGSACQLRRGNPQTRSPVSI